MTVSSNTKYAANYIGSNVVTMPWLRGIQVLPRRRMKFSDRKIYDTWHNWMAYSLADASQLGHWAAKAMFEEMAEEFGVMEPITFANAEKSLGLIASGYDVALDVGVRIAERRGKPIRSEAPPLPLVWPGPRHPSNISYWLRQDDILRYGLTSDAVA